MFKRKPPVPSGKRYCHACESARPVAEFYRNRSQPDGHDSQCKACRKVGARCTRERKATLEASFRLSQERCGTGLRMIDLVGLDAALSELAA